MELCRWITTEMCWKRKVLSRSSPETEISENRATIVVEWAQRFHRKRFENVHSVETSNSVLLGIVVIYQLLVNYLLTLH